MVNDTQDCNESSASKTAKSSVVTHSLTVGQCCETAAFGIGQRQSMATVLDCEDTISFWRGSHDLLPVTVDPASEHGHEDVPDRRCLTG
jgi:hypothetical protein